MDNAFARIETALKDLISYRLLYKRYRIGDAQFYEVRNGEYKVKSFATRIGDSKFADIEALVESVESWKVMNGLA